MSNEPTLVTARHFQYLAERTTREDRFLADLRAAARAAGIPPISICAEQGALLQILLRLRGVRDAVEVGTLAGYSAIWMARALPAGGTLRTIELVPHHADFAESWIARSDVADRVTVHRGDGGRILPTFATASADAAFLDADKAGYGAYLEECLRILRPGGLVVVDNAFAFGELFAESARDRETPAVRAFNDRMAAETRLQSVIVPLGDGMWVGVKRA